MYIFIQANIQSYGSNKKLKLRIVVKGDFQNKELIGYTWAPIASIRTLKYFLSDTAKNKTRVHQLDFIPEALLALVPALPRMGGACATY